MGHSVGVGVAGLVRHFEDALGPVSTGWVSHPNGPVMPFQVVRYARGPDTGSIGYSTLGLSRRALLGDGDPYVRQELVILATKSLPMEYVLTVLFDAGGYALRSGRAHHRGDVLGPVPPPVPGSSMAAMYVAEPVYLPDEFAVHDTDPVTGEEVPRVEVLWLVPITECEAQFVRTHGWEAFEELLEAQDPDLVDVYRAGVVLEPCDRAQGDERTSTR